MKCAVMEQITHHGYKDPEAITTEKLLLSARGKSVLVVEDNPDARAYFGRTLEFLGANVDFAENGRDAIQKAMYNVYDTILMDIAMPVCDGIEATQELRREGYEGWIVAVTAYPLPKGDDTIYSLGFDDYLLKPVNRLQLLHAIAFHPQPRHRKVPQLH